MAKYFAPLLAKGTGSFGQPSNDPKKKHTGVLVNMSARVGSISDNGEYCAKPVGGSPLYALSNLEIKCDVTRHRVCASLQVTLKWRCFGAILYTTHVLR